MGLDLEALKKSLLERGVTSQNAYNPSQAAEVLALIEELAEARLRLKPYEDARLLPESEVVARLKADLVHAHKVHAAEIRECQRIIANARAAALGEAARLVRARPYADNQYHHVLALADDIGALAQTPPSGRYVPDEVLAQVKDACLLAEEWCDIENKSFNIEDSQRVRRGEPAWGPDEEVAEVLTALRAALAALEGVKP